MAQTGFSPSIWYQDPGWWCFEEKARAVAGLAKGVEVYVEGRLSLNAWTGRDGAERTGLSVTAWRIEVLANSEEPAGEGAEACGGAR